MVKTFLKRYGKFCLSSDRKKASGFTLLELLVAMIVGGLISAGLLFIVVQLIQTNLRESARSDTQRDLQSAIDYIARDVREAVYVYDAECLLDGPGGTTATCPGLRNYLPDGITGTSGFGTSDNVPVLAFWRVDDLPQELKDACANPANNIAYSQNVTELPAPIRGVPCLSGRMYTLVVYSLNRERRTIANGRARIMRYTLPQFTSRSAETAPPTSVVGWVSPTGRDTSFRAWPVDRSTLSSTPVSLQTPRPTDTNPNEVLTDYVDWFGIYEASGRGRAPDRSAEELVLTPRNGTGTIDSTDPPRGFYVYVRGAAREGDLNQEVIIRIQGDAAGRPGIPDIGPSNRPRVPISLETRVLTRGVTNKKL